MPTTSARAPWEVLVVDDDEDVRDLIVSYFNSLGMLVTSADDGSAAISVLQRSGGNFSMVVTDLNLPGADGFAVLQAARKSNPDCYVVIVTGFASLDSAIHAVRVGAYDYLTKPFSLRQLDVVLKRIADSASGRRRRRFEEEGTRAPHPWQADTVEPSALDLTAIERSLDRLEAVSARIEAKLESVVRSPFSRL